jgi:hypothetical protein
MIKIIKRVMFWIALTYIFAAVIGFPMYISVTKLIAKIEERNYKKHYFDIKEEENQLFH